MFAGAALTDAPAVLEDVRVPVRDAIRRVAQDAVGPVRGHATTAALVVIQYVQAAVRDAVHVEMEAALNHAESRVRPARVHALVAQPDVLQVVMPHALLVAEVPVIITAPVIVKVDAPVPVMAVLPHAPADVQPPVRLVVEIAIITAPVIARVDAPVDARHAILHAAVGVRQPVKMHAADVRPHAWVAALDAPHYVQVAALDAAPTVWVHAKRVLLPDLNGPNTLQYLPESVRADIFFLSTYLS